MQNSGFRSLSQKEAALKNANKHFIGGDKPNVLAKDIAISDRVAQDANTLRLRTLRLAKEESDKLPIKAL